VPKRKPQNSKALKLINLTLTSMLMTAVHVTLSIYHLHFFTQCWDGYGPP